MSNICRTCMAKEQEMISIFNQGKSPSISDMIMAISAVEFSPSDTLPPQMCITCCETLEIAYSFKNQVIRINNALQRQAAETSKPLSPQVNEEEDELGGENEHFYKEQIEIFAENISFNDDPPSKCPESLTPSSTYDRSVENDIKSVNLEISLSRKSHDEVHAHFDETCIKTEVADEGSGQSNDNCKIIPQQILIKKENDDDGFSSEDDLPLTLVHVKIRSYNKFKEAQRNSNKNGEAARTVSKGDKLYKCPYCKKRFNRESTFTFHVDEHKNRNKCEVCEKTFPWRKNLVNHMRKHTGERPFKCQHCDASFMYTTSLKEHVRLHTGETRPNPYQCEDCGKTFDKPCRLKEHMRMHTGERPYECQVCNARFRLTTGLRNHIRLHTDEAMPKPYMCEVCGNTFYAPSHLTEHMRIHTGERPFKCQFCKASFALRGSMNKHLRLHTGKARPKPHKCEVCGKTFTSPCYLKQHMLCHTDDRPFRCQDCNAGFKRPCHLNRHIRLHTGEVTTNSKS